MVPTECSVFSRQLLLHPVSRRTRVEALALFPNICPDSEDCCAGSDGYRELPYPSAQRTVHSAERERDRYNGVFIETFSGSQSLAPEARKWGPTASDSHLSGCSRRLHLKSGFEEDHPLASHGQVRRWLLVGVPLHGPSLVIARAGDSSE